MLVTCSDRWLDETVHVYRNRTKCGSPSSLISKPSRAVNITFRWFKFSHESNCRSAIVTSKMSNLVDSAKMAAYQSRNIADANQFYPISASIMMGAKCVLTLLLLLIFFPKASHAWHIHYTKECACSHRRYVAVTRTTRCCAYELNVFTMKKELQFYTWTFHVPDLCVSLQFAWCSNPSSPVKDRPTS